MNIKIPEKNKYVLTVVIARWYDVFKVIIVIYFSELSNLKITSTCFLN